QTEGTSNWKISALTSIGLVLSVLQLLSGTKVREHIDVLAKKGVAIGMDNFHLLGTTFNVHRVLAIATGICLIAIWYANREMTRRPKTSLIVLATFAILVIQALTGIANVRFGFPATAQLIHVVFGSVTLVAFIHLTIHEFKSKRLQYVN
ncbi:MAG: COX15/CtaA family protein, partial [Bacteroidia bacterium]|nr:COX15/CtaA family protein [Bacteroidia bacterium]